MPRACAGNPSIADVAQFRYFCPEGSFNDMAAIWFTADETAIKQLLHVNTVNYDSLTLTVFALAFLLLSTPSPSPSPMPPLSSLTPRSQRS